ncbi:SDR family NAD(P)-dependent oxidoreductase [Mucilaginibacter roseus]|uniref:SDR family NAD(P)-dependent oxidoreductase n=1 Tax=Mucilaginibacter roseus TaxID=1528868 RepID=A0ABS8TW20_9SPHI|nr:SDR family NAD(P)-dependent oxidoreductase [Mucilaginibacter roseus]MCD8739026.1 SDR family NAD(P)-dependent oxidoreductase [Mucilaginibacter roseus]
MRKVLITGASGGIGLETAKQLAELGDKITLVARNQGKLKKAAEALSGSGHDMLVADLTNDDDLKKVLGHLKIEKYDILINNAGAGIYGRFNDIPLAYQLNGMHLNMDALVNLSYGFLQHARPGDTLVNVGSLLAHSSLPGGAVYAATKSFVANFSESLWYEYKDRNIFVMGFNPGAANSDFHTNAGGDTSDFPDFVMSSVQNVAGELIKAINNRSKPRVVQGWKNRFMLFGFKLLSRKAAVNIMGRISPGMQH